MTGVFVRRLDKEAVQEAVTRIKKELNVSKRRGRKPGNKQSIGNNNSELVDGSGNTNTIALVSAVDVDTIQD